MTENTTPARRMRHGQRPTEPLEFDEPAIANKAAEEGELPALPDALEIDWPEMHSQALGCGVEDRSIHDRYEAAEYGWQDGVDKAIERVPSEIYDADQMREYARQAIAADRAARPVANKAEVDLSSLKRYRTNAEPFSMREDADGNWVSLREVQDLIAFLPTTVAASIDTDTFHLFMNEYDNEASYGSLNKARNNLFAYIDQHVARQVSEAIATPPATTGASTVLTDERIDAIWGSAPGIGHKSHRYDFAREVAAQAGQVAVPEGFVLVPIDPAKALEMGWAYLDAAREESPGQKWSFSHAGYRAMIAAAPSPASESLRSPQEAVGAEKGQSK